jgi:hypothetical protein
MTNASDLGNHLIVLTKTKCAEWVKSGKITDYKFTQTGDTIWDNSLEIECNDGSELKLTMEYSE